MLPPVFRAMRRCTRSVALLAALLLPSSVGSMAAEPLQSHESHTWAIYPSSSPGCSEAESGLMLRLVEGAITAHASRQSGGSVRFARDAGVLVVVLGERGCRYGVAASLGGRVSSEDLRALANAAALAPPVPGARCEISMILFALKGGVLNLHVGSIGSRGEPEPVAEPAIIADGNIAAMLNAPPCGVHVTGGRLD